MVAKRKPQIGKLDTVGRVSAELGKVYRAVRRGEIAEDSANLYARILHILRQSLEVSDLERRLEELEKQDPAASTVNYSANVTRMHP